MEPPHPKDAASLALFARRLNGKCSIQPS